MPRRDGTGPDGLGPCTGRGLGPCARSARPENPEAPESGTEQEAKQPDFAPPRGGRGLGRRFAPRRPVRRQEGPWNNGEPISEQINRLQESLDALRDAIGKKENS